MKFFLKRIALSVVAISVFFFNSLAYASMHDYYSEGTLCTIQSIDSPDISVSNGTPVENWPLPAAVSFVTNAPEDRIKMGLVDWDITAFFGQDGEISVDYDPAVEEEQVVVVFGKLNSLPNTILNPNEIAVRLDVTIFAKVTSPSIPNTNNKNTDSADADNKNTDSADADNKSTDSADVGNFASNIFEQWITVTLDGNHAQLFGIITTTDVIEPGSNFFVEIVQDDKNLLDKDVPIKTVEFLDIGVIKPSGEKYEGNLKSAVDIYCQWPEQWNKENHAMLKLTSEKDIEQLFVGFTEFDNVAYADYKFSEFAPPYAFIEKKSNDNKWVQITLISLGVLAICGVGGWIYYKKRKNLRNI